MASATHQRERPMRLDAEMVRDVITEAVRSTVRDVDAAVVDAIAAEACGEATPDQLALVWFLFETPKGENDAERDRGREGG